MWLTANGTGFSRIAHEQSEFLLPCQENNKKTLKFDEILFIKVESVQMSDKEHRESEFYYPEVDNEGYETVFCQFSEVYSCMSF